MLSSPSRQGAGLPNLPRWTTVLYVGAVLLLFFGVLGAVLGITLGVIRARMRRNVGDSDVVSFEEGLIPDPTGPQLGVSATLLLLVDLVAILAAQYLGTTLWWHLTQANVTPSDLLSLEAASQLRLVDVLVFEPFLIFLMYLGGRYGRIDGVRRAAIVSCNAVLAAAFVEWLTLMSGAASGHMTQMLLANVFALVLLPIGFYGCRVLLADIGVITSRVFLVGREADVVRAKSRHSEPGQWTGIVVTTPTEMTAALSRALGELEPQRLDDTRIVLCATEQDLAGSVELCRQIESRGVACRIHVDLGVGARDGLAGPVELQDGVMVANGMLGRVRPLSQIIKRAIDIAGAVVGLMILGLVLLAVGWKVKSDGGPLFLGTPESDAMVTSFAVSS